MTTRTLTPVIDAYLYREDSTYAGAVAGGTTGAEDDADTVLRLGQETDGSTFWDCYESFVSFDTSAFASVTSVELWFQTAAGNWHGAVEARLYSAWDEVISGADYRTPAQLAALPLLASYDGTVYPGDNVDVQFTENGTALRDNVNFSGHTRIVLDSVDLRTSTPPVGLGGQMLLYSADNGILANGPRLIVTGTLDPVDVAGVTAGTSGVPAATLDLSKPVVGVSAGQSTMSAYATQVEADVRNFPNWADAFMGTAPATGNPVAVAGVTAGTSGDTGAIGVVRPGAGVTAGVSTATGVATNTHPIAGVSAGTSTVSAGLQITFPLAGRSDGAATVAGDLTDTHQIAGESEGVSTATAFLTIVAGLAGESDGTSGAAGALFLLTGLAGATAGSSAASAGIVLDIALSGTTGSDGQGSADGVYMDADGAVRYRVRPLEYAL